MGIAMYLQPRLNASNDRIIELWLSRKSRQTQRVYRYDIQQFLTFIGGKHLKEITLPDLVEYLNSPAGGGEGKGGPGSSLQGGRGTGGAKAR